MKTYCEELWVNYPNRRGFINITSDVHKILSHSSIKDGLVLVNTMYVTASVFINDDESGLLEDYKKWLEKLAAHGPINQSGHNDSEEENTDVYMNHQIKGRDVVMSATDGKLDFGPREQIFYRDFDSGRPKRILVKIIGE